ncbi:protein GRAVITROPIC IN THE LIGHT 1-like [Mangifera indica]|uniref:protein GRAVITROPIC IN THE LIGHT 1-like n=1 Tax=Mangifera indica TaxID=29780 RepID=UPI001CFBCE20|nr:protein GRAVITROPIC IN THE LIGHT 1-like [Mangifera indica]
METVRPKSALSGKSKLAKTFQKVINLRRATKNMASNNGIGICILTSQHKFGDEDSFCMKRSSNNHMEKHGDPRARQRAVMEALVAKLFAGITSIKAAYAELQMAQNPYNSEAIHAADQAVVDELKAISELKRSFFKKELDLSPQVTIMLAEIQEQQSLMKTYGITIKKLEAEVEKKESEISSLEKQLQEALAFNKTIEKRLNASGPISILDNLQLSALNPSHFVQFLHYTLRSVRSFVKLMIKEMESAIWDLDAAAKVIEPEAIFTKPSHKYFAFESFVCKTMFEGFNFPNFSPNECQSFNKIPPEQSLDEFKKLKSVNAKHFLSQKQNSSSSFAKFTRAKYFHLVHAKMECSLFGNLNQRKLINHGDFPDSIFFIYFGEMARRVWLLHRLAFSFGQEVNIFEVRRNCRFSEVFMENVSDDSMVSCEIPDSGVDFRVNFTVVPGFKIGKTVIQSQVYLSPVTANTAASPELYI